MLVGGFLLYLLILRALQINLVTKPSGRDINLYNMSRLAIEFPGELVTLHRHCKPDSGVKGKYIDNHRNMGNLEEQAAHPEQLYMWDWTAITYEQASLA